MQPGYREPRNAQEIRTRLCCALAVVGLGLGGCGNGFVSGSGADVVDGNRGLVTSSVGKIRGEPNDSFGTSIVVVFDDAGVAKLEGTVARQGDLDVYSLGPLAAGDRVVVDTSTIGSALDISISLFDDQGRLTIHNDDRTTGNLDSHIDWIVRHSGSEYRLVVTNAAFADFTDTTGSYRVDITVEPGADVPAPKLQILVLDFDGGIVDSPALGQVSIAPFDAGAIDELYADHTNALKAAIREVMEQNFAGFAVSVLTTDDVPPLPGTSFTSIFFGGLDIGAFGISESVDVYNQDSCDDAIIYTETFRPRACSFDPSVAQLAVAIGNVASHEAGHLLGLNHVDNDDALMDDRSPADFLLLDQEFMEAALSTDIMRIGSQDSRLLLEETVGLTNEIAARSAYGFVSRVEVIPDISSRMIRKRTYAGITKAK